MSETALITMGGLASLALALCIAAAVMPSLTRIYWIVGLAFALLFYGGLFLGEAVRGIRHRHLNSKGLTILATSGYLLWMIVPYLAQKMKEPKSTRRPD